MLSFSIVLVFRKKIKAKSYSPNLVVFFLLLFVSLEILLPIVGMVVWADVSSVSSSFRAFIYWFPFLLLLLLYVPGSRFDLSKLDGVICLAVFLNLFYGLIELGMYLEYLPSYFNFRPYVAGFAPQDRFLNNRVMSFGFFQNSTAYGVFGFISLVHFLSRLLENDRNKFKYLMFSLFSFVIIVLSTSRVPLASSFIAISFFVFLSRKTQWNLFLSGFIFVLSFLSIVILFSTEFILFSRFTRLIEGGLTGDYSLNQRLTVHWPQALEFYRDLGHPVFTNPAKYLELIDSGYITYYVQGGGMMLAVTFLFITACVFSPILRIIKRKDRSYYCYSLLLLGVYLLLGMFISNPLRNPIVIAFLCYVIFGFSVKSKVSVNRENIIYS